MAKTPVLVLDDDPATARVASSVLEKRGYEIAATADPEEALKLANRLVPDVMIINGAEARLKGTPLVRVLRTRPATALIPTLFVGDRKAFEPQITGFRLGSDGFLAKPLNPTELDVQVTRALREKARVENSIRPAAAPEKEFSVSPLQTAFRGNLDELGLPSLLTLLEMERKTGQLVLIVEPEGEKVRLFLRKGQLVRAKLDLLDAPKNADLVYDLLTKTKGKFDFRAQAVDAADEINMPMPNLLLEGARRMDESRKDS